MRRQLALLLGALVLTASTACLILPLPANNLSGGRGMVLDADQAALVEGQTTREEVLLRWGEPDDFQGGGAVFIYHWTVGRGFMISAGGGGGVIERTHLLRLEFDPTGRLVRFNHLGAFGSRSGPLLERAEDRSFKVALPAPPVAADPISTAPSLHLGPVEDLRFDKVRIGTRSSFGAQMADVYPEQDPAQHLGAVLANEARAAGFQLTDSGPQPRLHLRLNRLWVHTTNTLLYWDVIADIDCDLVVSGVDPKIPHQVRHFTARRKERTYLWPSAGLCTKALAGVMDDLRTRLRSDGIWAELHPQPGPGVPVGQPITPAPAPRSAP